MSKGEKTNISTWNKYTNIEKLGNVSVYVNESLAVIGSDNINELAKCYFNNYNPDYNPVKGKQSSCYVEDEVFGIMKKETDWSEIDVKNILAWKVGKIKHTESKTSFIYHKDWGDKDNNNIHFPNGKEPINFEDLTMFLNKKRKEYKGNNDIDNTNRIWGELIKESKNYSGLGTVYLITLMHFITSGEYPIYDRFAMASLVAWKLHQLKNGIKIPRGSIINVGSLPDKTHKDVASLLDTENNDSMYKKYIGLLNEFCSCVYGKTNKYKWKLIKEDKTIKEENDFDKARNIDRALWVYGHFFDVRQ